MPKSQTTETVTETAETVTVEMDATLQDLARHVANQLNAGEAANQEAEAILFAAAEGNRPLTFQERQRLHQLRAFDDKTIAREIRRASRVLSNQKIAGTTADRSALAEAVAAAADDLETRGQTLRQEIEERQRLLRSLETHHNGLQRRTDDVSRSLAALRELLPSHVAAEVQAHRKAFGSTLKRELLDIKSELNHRSILREGPKPTREHDWLSSMQRQGVRVEFAQVPGGGSRQVVDPSMVAELFARWDAEKPAKEQRAAELQGLLAEAEADQAAASEFYFR